MMKLKVGHVFEAMFVLDKVISEKRPLPQKGTYRLARMHAKLAPEFKTIVERRDALITPYGHKAMIKQPDPVSGVEIEIEAPNFSVPDDKMPEFLAAWGEIAGEEIEVNIEPVPIDQLSADGAAANISYAEFTALGDLVAG